jgi:hypothetical protein
MNILIENEATIEYLTAAGNWTKNPHDGKRFSATMVAFRAAKQGPVGRFNIVGHIPETNQIINLNHGQSKGPPGESVEQVAAAN